MVRAQAGVMHWAHTLVFAPYQALANRTTQFEMLPMCYELGSSARLRMMQSSRRLARDNVPSQEWTLALIYNYMSLTSSLECMYRDR